MSGKLALVSVSDLDSLILDPCVHRERPSYRRRLPLSKRTSSTSKHVIS
jgi:hypothetical protein